MNPIMHSPSRMRILLNHWVAQGWLRDIDEALAIFLTRSYPDSPPALMLAIAWVSHQLGRGHVCLDLMALQEDPNGTLALPPNRETEAQTPDPCTLLRDWQLNDWLNCLDQPDLIGLDPSQNASVTPLKRVGYRLYLTRFWRHERHIESALVQRLTLPLPPHLNALFTSPSRFKETLNKLFPKKDTGMVDWQKVACLVATRHAFSIITGGPGTGKTTTVVRLLALLQSLSLAQQGAPLRIHLAAPTGKAAARLKSSITSAIANLPSYFQEDKNLMSTISCDVMTLHRLLGSRAQSRQFRHHEGNPLALDVLVIDEASMVDLELMANIIQALPTTASLILLGDKDQLASVEAGSVMGELCRRAEAGHYLPQTLQVITSLSGECIDSSLADEQGLPLDQAIVMLRHSHRFSDTSGIGQLARAIHQGDAPQIKRITQQNHADVRRHDVPQLDEPWLRSFLIRAPSSDQYPLLSDYLTLLASTRPQHDEGPSAFAHWANIILTAQARFQLLCAIRQGPYGVTGLNPLIEALLAQHHLIQPSTTWYEGRPVMVTRNDYGLGLMNGDMGVALRIPLLTPEKSVLWGLRVAFSDSTKDGGIHWVLPSHLLSAETVFALTVHKSQGSEFDHAALLLPPTPSPVLTRELIYTAVTRGKSLFSLITVDNNQLFEAAAQKTVQRSGGLFSASQDDGG